jgi:hypothetical protein
MKINFRFSAMKFSKQLGDRRAQLNTTWVLVPKHLLPEVQRLMSGKTVGPDDTPSTIDQIYGYEHAEEPPYVDEKTAAAGKEYLFLKR